MTGIDIYIDGACSGNPGPGGWAAVTVINGKKLASCGHALHSTNNGMELSAAIGGLKALKQPRDVTFYTDSAYLVTCSKHDDKWLTSEKRKNRELWRELIAEAKKGRHKVHFVKVTGHAGVTMNELADKLARAECRKARHKLNENV